MLLKCTWKLKKNWNHSDLWLQSGSLKSHWINDFFTSFHWCQIDLKTQVLYYTELFSTVSEKASHYSFLKHNNTDDYIQWGTRQRNVTTPHEK